MPNATMIPLRGFRYGRVATKLVHTPLTILAALFPNSAHQDNNKLLLSKLIRCATKLTVWHTHSDTIRRYQELQHVHTTTNGQSQTIVFATPTKHQAVSCNDPLPTFRQRFCTARSRIMTAKYKCGVLTGLWAHSCCVLSFRYLEKHLVCL